MTKKAVYVDLTRYPELYEKLMELAEENLTTPPPIVRKFIKDGLKQAGKSAKAKEKVKQINR